MSKELEYEIKDCMNLMECLKKQGEDNKPILYLGKHYEKVILPYEEYQKMCNRLEAIDNANPSEALKEIKTLRGFNQVELNDKNVNKSLDIIEQALHRLEAIDNAEPSEALEELELVENWIRDRELKSSKVIEPSLVIIKQALLKAQKEHNSVNLLMQELDCKDFADLRKYARCGYEKLNKQYLKWEDLEFTYGTKTQKVRMGDRSYTLIYWKFTLLGKEYYTSELRNEETLDIIQHIKGKLFNDLHLERVEE